MDNTFPPVRKAVIPIAGWGTRMYPATKCVPKALFPITDLDGICKPVIHVIVEEALSALGPEGEVCIVIQDGQQHWLNDYFKTAALNVYTKKSDLMPVISRIEQIGSRIHYVLQEEQKGFGHAVLCAKDWVGNEPFLVLLGDHVYTSSHLGHWTPAQQVLKIYKSTGKSVTSLDTCKGSDLGVNGVVKGNILPSDPASTEPKVFDLIKILEKPSEEVASRELVSEGLDAGSYLCFFGIDLLVPRVFGILQHHYENSIFTKGELQLRDAMNALMLEEGMQAVLIQGKRLDTGNPWEYATAVEAYQKEYIRRQSSER